MGPIDLQAHSRHSDGELEVRAVVEAAARAGVGLLALTDHDTVDGVGEALAAARRAGIGLLRATEISAVDGVHEDLHILGYGIDHRDERLLERLADARADRDRRAQRMSDLLRGAGYALDEEPLARRRAEGKPIGRPHLAAAVLAHPDNASQLEAEGHSDISSFIAAHLIPGAASYAGRTRPTAAEAIGWVHEAGGLAFWAHPFWDIDDDAELLDCLERQRAAGLDGVECFYASFDRRQTLLLADRCEQAGLLRSASSDYHGPGHRLFGRFLAYELHGRAPALGRLAAAG